MPQLLNILHYRKKKGIFKRLLLVMFKNKNTTLLIFLKRDLAILKNGNFQYIYSTFNDISKVPAIKLIK